MQKKDVLEEIFRLSQALLLVLRRHRFRKNYAFIQLIARLYDATEGTVFVKNDVRSYNLVSLDAVSVVLQKNVLFSGTVRDNLLWEILTQLMRNRFYACSIACADEFRQDLVAWTEILVKVALMFPVVR